MAGASYDGPAGAVQASLSTTDLAIICACVCIFALDAYKFELSIYSVNFPGSRLSSHHMLLHILCLPLVQMQSNQLWS